MKQALNFVSLSYLPLPYTLPQARSRGIFPDPAQSGIQSSSTFFCAMPRALSILSKSVSSLAASSTVVFARSSNQSAPPARCLLFQNYLQQVFLHPHLFLFMRPNISHIQVFSAYSRMIFQHGTSLRQLAADRGNSFCSRKWRQNAGT